MDARISFRFLRLLICLATVFSLVGAYGQSTSSPTVTLSLAGQPASLAIDLGDLHVLSRTVAEDQTGMRISARNENGIVMNAWLLRMKVPQTPELCRELYWITVKNGRGKAKPENAKLTEEKGVARLQFEIPVPQNRQFREVDDMAFFGAGNICGVVQIGKLKQSEHDVALLREYISGAKFQATSGAATSVSSVTVLGSSNGKNYSHQVNLGKGNGNTVNLFDDPSYHPPTPVAPESVAFSSRFKVFHSTKKLYFVAIGEFPNDTLDDLISYYRANLNLEIKRLSPVALDVSAVDMNRHQVQAMKLIASIRNAHRELANSPEAIVIGFTNADMYIAGKNWRFAFGWRAPDSHMAVVSTARLDIHYTGEPILQATPDIRLKKLVTKDIGILYFGLPQTSDSGSVLFENILGIDDLDRVAETF